MAQEKIYPKGIATFKPNDKAPSFVKGTMVVTPNEFIQWLKENEKLLTDYKGKKQIRFNILEGDKGLYFTVDTYKPLNNKFNNIEDDMLPF